MSWRRLDIDYWSNVNGEILTQSAASFDPVSPENLSPSAGPVPVLMSNKTETGSPCVNFRVFPFAVYEDSYIRLQCGRCDVLVVDREEEITLAELSQRAEKHAEECTPVTEKFFAEERSHLSADPCTSRSPNGDLCERGAGHDGNHLCRITLMWGTLPAAPESAEECRP